MGRNPRAGILRVDAGLDRVPVELDVVLGERQLLAGAHPQLPLDQVQPGDRLGDRMFHLQAGIHLHEEELVGPVGGDDELHSAGADVVDAAGGVAGRGPDPRARLGVKQRRRRLLDDLLVAPLQAALTLTEMHHVAVRVGKHLHLDMPGPQHKSLQKQGVVTERRGGLPSGGHQRLAQSRRVLHQMHALAAAARGRLDQHRIADIFGRRDELVVGQPRPGHPGHHRHVEGGDRVLGGDLVAHHLDRACRRAQEHHPGAFACGGEMGVLGKEPVARMDRLGSGARRRVQHLVDVEVALARRGGSQPHRGVRLEHVPGVGVGVAVDGDRPDTQPAQGADHPHRDLAAVGHQYRFEHRTHIRNTP